LINKYSHFEKYYKSNLPYTQSGKEIMIDRIKNLDVKLIYDMLDEYIVATQAGDFDRWMALWIEDGVQMAPYVPIRTGKEQIGEAMQPVFDNTYTKNLIIHTEEVQILGDQAYSHGTFTFDVETKDGGDKINNSGKFIAILKKQVDGSWRIAIDCHNYDKPSTQIYSSRRNQVLTKGGIV
jgi:uncharacterized protein (TIGR02246 family)